MDQTTSPKKEKSILCTSNSHRDNEDFSDDGRLGSDDQSPSTSSDFQETAPSARDHAMPLLDILNVHYPDDGRHVGTDILFNSPNVVPHRSTETTPNPHKRMGIPTPSIYYDGRGEIHNIKVNDKRINILYTKAGHLRSGDLHPNEQLDFLFSGKVRLWTLRADGTTRVATYGKHEFVTIPRATPHVFEFVEDTVLAEWWEPQGFQAWFYKPYRDIVNGAMRVAQSGEDTGKDGRRGLVVLSPTVCGGDWRVCGMVLAGAALGGALGFAFGKHRIR